MPKVHINMALSISTNIQINWLDRLILIRSVIGMTKIQLLGMCFLLCLIVWLCKKMNIRSLPTAQAKYKGVMNARIEAIWIHNMMVEIRFYPKELTTMYCENYSAI
jgi:hypothetical protein